MDNRKKQSLRNPEETTNFLNLLFFGWLVPIFWKGSKSDLGIEDIYDPLKADESESLGNRLAREWEKELKKANREIKLGTDGKKKSPKKPSLLLALVRVFWVPFTIQGLLTLFMTVVLKVLQPVLQGWIISYFSPSGDRMTREEVLIDAGLLIIVTIITILIYHHSSLQCQRIGMCVRVACCSLIYRKILRLDQAALSKTAAGQVANLISNDVVRFDWAFLFIHYIWIMPIQVLLIGYVMWQFVGPSALVGIGFMIIQSTIVQGYFSKVSTRLRSQIAAKTDERVQLMSELISGIQVVKMYSWEKPFELIVAKVRALEMKFIAHTSYLRGIHSSVMVFSERATLYVTLITFVLMGNPLTAEVTFVLATLYNILQATCAICFPQAIVMAGEASVSLERLTDFLVLDEVKSAEKVVTTVDNMLKTSAKTTSPFHQTKHEVEVEMVKVAANWVYGQLPPTLCDISIRVKSRSLCAIVGPVGSGKSSLLQLLLGELPVGAGKAKLFTGENGQTRITSRDIRISYTSQDPWLFSASVRDNILFGEPYDEGRYKEVTRVCALLKDFEQLPQGDLSYVGERGSSLSGGQKARVSLARAVYREAELYLLDDPLSAVDARVGRHLFEECITGFLKNKTRILVTHQLQHLRQADTVVVLNRGTVECQGTYEEMAQSGVFKQDSNDSQESEKLESTEKNDQENVKSKNTVGDDNNQPSEDTGNTEGYTDVSEEEIAKGKMSSKVYSGYISAGGKFCSLAFLAVIFILGQVASSGSDFWVTYWTNQETLRATLKLNGSVEYYEANRTVSNDQEAGLRWFDEYGLVSSIAAIYVYSGCIFGCIFFITLRGALFMRMCMEASRNIHNSMFSNLLRATMRFFNTNPSGRILNRFSKDVGVMDEQLPRILMETLQIFIVMIGVLTLIVIVNIWMIIPVIIIGVMFYMLRVYYLKTAQSLKRLEGIAKSPVLSHVSSTLEGLTTIRSRGDTAMGMLQKEFDCHQDTHSGAWYLTIAGLSGFGCILDLVSCVFIACVCFSFILMDDGETLGGNVGLAISQSLILTIMVQYGIRQSAEAVAQFTSVERVLQYTKLPKEGPFTTDNPPPPTWPSKGGLVFKEVSMRYAENKPPVLKGLNLNIKPGWKVGIVGRTGAGKSSLISALFALTGEGLEGEISLDGIDTKSIGLHELRPRISIIPQEPILFSASLRYNLDPFEQYSDAELWDSLREVELGDAVPSLDFRVAGGGANFSVGQRQLICLARAILRNNRVLVLDEATANIDSVTDALIQNTIRRRFTDCTVLTIAHRLNTIMDSDRVLVMSAGRAVEFGHPHQLLKNPHGQFSEMVYQTGKSMADKLAGMAETAHLASSEFNKESEDDLTGEVEVTQL